MVYDNVLKNPNDFNFKVQQLGLAQHDNPSDHESFINDDERIAFSSQVKNLSWQFKTNLVIGYWNNFFTHVPIHLATKERRMVELDSALWRGVVSADGEMTAFSPRRLALKLQRRYARLLGREKVETAQLARLVIHALVGDGRLVDPHVRPHEQPPEL